MVSSVRTLSFARNMSLMTFLRSAENGSGLWNFGVLVQLLLFRIASSLDHSPILACLRFLQKLQLQQLFSQVLDLGEATFLAGTHARKTVEPVI